jgi:hypothetical protein
MSKVIVRLMGGLGNQLFQYATGHAVAKRLGVPLLLDRTFLDSRPPGMDWTPRAFELDAFRAPIAFADPEEVRRFRRPIDGPVHRRLQRALPFLYPAVHLERAPGYDPGILRHKAPLYLEGFFQHERYFADAADALRNDLFVPRERPDARNAALLQAMTAGITASVHVRRGDYVTNAASNRFHGVCPPEYYARAAAELAQQHGVERFFVFSDDPEWTRANLSLPRPAEHVSHNTERAAHWDLYLMKHCRHHIIANSSFSWWGAWLDARPDSVVIAPAQWFAGTGTPAAAIIPPAWNVR